MLKKTQHLVLRISLGGGLILALTLGYFLYKGRETVSWLVHPGATPQTTTVYSRWLELSPQNKTSWGRVVGWLEALDYKSVLGSPQKPGEYTVNGSDLIIFANAFRYPDKDYPAQILHLSFSDRRLSHIEAVAGHVTLPDWRLEPKTFALWSAGGQRSRMPIHIAELPPYVPRAVLSMEDKRFFSHGAFDAVGIARAFWVDVRSLHLRQGASTISQQLARSIFLDVQRTWRRKVLEAALAFYLELRYSKPQLLEMYLNQVYWGQDGSESLLGLEAASESYFGKAPKDLTIAESATLAGMLQSPNHYSPRVSPDLAEDRKEIVLGLMHDQHVITDDQFKSAMGEKIILAPPKKVNEAAYFLATLRDQLAQNYEVPVFTGQGWKIFTTLDPLLQQAAAETMKAFPSPSPLPGERASGARGEGPQAALVALDPKTGEILAWVGGTNFLTNPFDHAIDAKRQPGSAFKPFVVLAALESRKMTAATLLDDKPIQLKGIHGMWSPQNYDRKYRGKASLWDSLVYSLNVPTVRAAMTVGLSPIIDVAQRAGIESPLRQDLSLALGTSEVSLLELTCAYATLANGGVHALPYSILNVVGPEGKNLESGEPVTKQVFDPEPVGIVTQMLGAVMTQGTGKAARALGFLAPAAGKTGTSENYQDAWFMGYTTELVAGVWVGFDKPKSLGRAAAGIALPIWTDFMKKADLYNPAQAFATPNDLVWKTVDPASGLLVKSGCPVRERMPFVAGTEPIRDCPLHPGGIVGFFKRFRAKP